MTGGEGLLLPFGGGVAVAMRNTEHDAGARENFTQTKRTYSLRVQ